METEATQSNIRIYVACLASYNKGMLHGAWIDATQGVEHIEQHVKAMLKVSPCCEEAEEWAIHDYEGFEGASLSEYTSFQSVCDMADFIEAHEELGGKLIKYYGSLDDAREAMENYIGRYASLEDYAHEVTEGTTDIPEPLRRYIDYEAMGHDMEINGLIVIRAGFEEHHIFYLH